MCLVACGCFDGRLDSDGQLALGSTSRGNNVYPGRRKGMVIKIVGEHNKNIYKQGAEIVLHVS